MSRHTALLLMLVAAGIPSSTMGFADEKKDKARAEELKKLLAESDAAQENDDTTKITKTYLTFLTEFLSKSEHIEIFRLVPDLVEKPDKKDEAKLFRKYQITATVSVKNDEDRKAVAAYLGKALHWNKLREALCFNPRHGVRATTGKETFDFLICFECCRVSVYNGEKIWGNFPLIDVEGDNPLERLLTTKKKDAGK